VSYKENNRRGGPTEKRVVGSGGRGRLAIAKTETYFVDIYIFYLRAEFQTDRLSRYSGNALAPLKAQFQGFLVLLNLGDLFNGQACQ
jgi:hypothetical protein